MVDTKFDVSEGFLKSVELEQDRKQERREMQLNGSQIFVEVLCEQGVDTLFGYPGGAVLNLYDELYKNSDRITHVLTAHEQGAAHAADGYARSTGKVGVCFATSGPGATNLTTGIATAYYDSSPVVFITCNVTENLLGKDAFQEVDITGITMPITKQNFLVNKPEELAQTMRLAFQMAKSGRPGPVLVDVAHDVQTSMMEYHASKLRELPVTMPQKELVAAAVAALNKAERPVMLVGGGELEKQIQEKVNALQLRDHVRFTGIRSDVPALLSAMDVFVFPSLYEGMPNTVIEAQATGLPCIISDTITKEADVTGLVEYLPLQNAKKWAEKLYTTKKGERIDTIGVFQKYHYDIESTCRKFVELIFEDKT